MDDFSLLRWICQKDFLCFCLAVKEDFTPTKFHVLLADKLQSVYERVKGGQHVRMMLEMPPRHGKTTMASVLFPAWVMGKESWPYVCASYGADLAENNSQDSRSIVDSDVYKVIFPKTRLSQDSTSKQLWKTTTKSSYRAVGVGGGLTGMGGKIMACDDPFKDRADADSETIRENVWKWWQSVFMTRREGKTGVIVLNTRWHLDDLSGRLLQQEQDLTLANIPHDKWERFRFPAVAEEDEYIDGKLFRKQGEALWPEKFPLEDLEKTRTNSDIYEWSSLYQQNPILSENQEFRAEWFRYFEDKDLEGKDLEVYATVDLAISEKKSADNTSVQVVGKEKARPERYKLEELTGRLDAGTVINYIFDLKKKYGGRLKKVGIETVAFQKIFLNLLKEEMRKRDVYIDFEELKAESKKSDRIRGLIPLYKNGVIYHRKGTDIPFETELLQFPKGKHDDRIDAFAYINQLIPATSYGGGVKRYVPRSTTYVSRELVPAGGWKEKQKVILRPSNANKFKT